MQYLAVVIFFVLMACASQPLPAPIFERPPPTPAGDLNQVDWLGPKPTLGDLDQYVENFRKLAFWTEWNGRHPYVKKWSKPIVCAPKKYRGYVDATLLKLNLATGVRYRASSFSCDVVVKERPGLPGCGANRQGYVFIGHSISIAECIEEELSQLSGLYNDIDYRWTMWNDANIGTVNRLTWHDAVMLRVLYQNELYQSMPETEAMQIVPRLMRKVILEIQ